jgi:hypothetical protein
MLQKTDLDTNPHAGNDPAWNRAQAGRLEKVRHHCDVCRKSLLQTDANDTQP